MEIPDLARVVRPGTACEQLAALSKDRAVPLCDCGQSCGAVGGRNAAAAAAAGVSLHAGAGVGADAADDDAADDDAAAGEEPPVAVDRHNAMRCLSWAQRCSHGQRYLKFIHSINPIK